MSAGGRMPVKKEENGDASDDDFNDDRPIAARRPNAKPSAAKKAKKEEADDDLDEPIVKKKPASEGSDKKGNKKEKEVVKKIVKKDKKVYALPGQKRDPPEERDPLRIFYETLYQQVPTSEMAQIWMMESGLLPVDVAKKVLEKKQKKTPTLRSPAKTPSATTTTTKSVTVKRELSSATKTTTKSVTVKEQPSSADATKKKKILSNPSKKRKTADASDEDEYDDDFEVISQPKKRKLAG